MNSLAEQVSDRLGRELEAGGLSNPNKWREEITDAHKAATTEAERVLCLSLLNLVNDMFEQWLIECKADPEDLQEAQKLRYQSYLCLLYEEATIGRTDGIIPPEKLAAITRREVAAGRMSPDDEVHKMSVAVEAVRKPVPVPASTVWTLNALVILVLVAAAALIVFVIDYAVNAYLR